MKVSANGASATERALGVDLGGVPVADGLDGGGGGHEVDLAPGVAGHDEVEEVRVVEQVLHERAPAHAPEPGHPVLDVGDEALARLLAVVADVDPGLDLRGDDGGGGGAHRSAELGRVDVLAPTAPAVELGEGTRPGQAPGVGGEHRRLALQHDVYPDAVGTVSPDAVGTVCSDAVGTVCSDAVGTVSPDAAGTVCSDAAGTPTSSTRTPSGS